MGTTATSDGWHSRGYLTHEVARLVETALLRFGSERYRLHAWVVMPNHVHAVLSPVGDVAVCDGVESWKKYTGRCANRLLGRTGAFWQRECFDRFIRSEHHFEFALAYIERNPVKAGLCEAPWAWPWGSAARRHAAEGGLQCRSESGAP